MEKARGGSSPSKSPDERSKERSLPRSKERQSRFRLETSSPGPAEDSGDSSAGTFFYPEPVSDGVTEDVMDVAGAVLVGAAVVVAGNQPTKSRHIAITEVLAEGQGFLVTGEVATTNKEPVIDQDLYPPPDDQWELLPVLEKEVIMHSCSRSSRKKWTVSEDRFSEDRVDRGRVDHSPISVSNPVTEDPNSGDHVLGTNIKGRGAALATRSRSSRAQKGRADEDEDAPSSSSSSDSDDSSSDERTTSARSPQTDIGDEKDINILVTPVDQGGADCTAPIDDRCRRPLQRSDAADPGLIQECLHSEQINNSEVSFSTSAALFSCPPNGINAPLAPDGPGENEKEDESGREEPIPTVSVTTPTPPRILSKIHAAGASASSRYPPPSTTFPGHGQELGSPKAARNLRRLVPIAKPSTSPSCDPRSSERGSVNDSRSDVVVSSRRSAGRTPLMSKSGSRSSLLSKTGSVSSIAGRGRRRLETTSSHARLYKGSGVLAVDPDELTYIYQFVGIHSRAGGIDGTYFHEWSCIDTFFAPNKEYCTLHIINMHSRYAFVKTLKKSAPNAEDTRLFLEEARNRGLLAKNLLADQGGEFNNQEIWNYCTAMGVKLCLIPKSPWVNGVVERRHKTLKNLIDKLTFIYGIGKYPLIVLMVERSEWLMYNISQSLYSTPRHGVLAVDPDELSYVASKLAMESLRGQFLPTEM